ncbi:MAG: 16S rRNA (adenine(1518)-N(6)/adenine(1519)-N(6))-dimethyltransferase RsmA [Actinomycetota bacterium]|nr:16S rRNA (adenine(1518)-N(6)/adenine(1519)-N(6))-dimethyltransferase RsmA [Actinomycetota bacterium]
MSPGLDVRRQLAASGLRPRKRLGQNFVVDQNTLRRMVRLAKVGPGDRVVEIGAGLGSLTLFLVEQGALVTAVEMDPQLIPILRSVCGPHAVRVVEADALGLDWDGLLGTEPGWILIGNLPYNIAARLVLKVLEEVSAVARIVVMVQKEVAERLAAGVGDTAYGAVSVKAAYWSTPRLLGTVPATVFYPRPHVDSAVVELERREPLAVDPSVVPYAFLFRLVKAGFSQRRKMLRSSLAGLVSPSAFDCSGISERLRAEDLDLDAWGRLARCVIESSNNAN